ncbi:MAG TPA: 3-phosphoshikimate 1-carboxyvinyltransferase, partial [Sphingobacteriaceae bacterium]
MSSGNLVISGAKEKLSGTVQLTGSKSESNRALIMQALSGGKVKVENLSLAADTVTLEEILNSKLKTSGPRLIDVGPAGTAMRFLTAFATLQEGEITLTGTERMKQRPVGILTDALKELGAKVEFPEKDGFPPVKLTGPLQQSTNQITIKGNVSSQYISALLLIAPNLPQGLHLTIDGELT